MKRIAIISDIHSNLTALEATLKNIDKSNVDYIYCLGDMIGKGPRPNEVVNLCRKNCDKIILGNWEHFLLNTKLKENPIMYYQNNLSDENKDFFKKLDYHIEFKASKKIVRMFHANPNDIYKRVYYNEDSNKYVDMFDIPSNYQESLFDKRSDIAVYGDIHYQFKIDFNSILKDDINELEDKILINTGSVGQSFDSIFASYLTMDIYEDDLSFEFVKLQYDNALEAKYALESGMFDKHQYAREILTGIFRGFYMEG